MKLISWAITIVLCIAFLAYIGGITVTLKPFCVHMPYWNRALAVLLMILALVVYSAGEYGRGYNTGFEDGIDYSVKYIIKKFHTKDL